MAIEPVNSQAMNIATAFRGLYARVASRLDVDPSYVSRVARGERESEEIVQALDREMSQIIRLSEFNCRSRRHAANRKVVYRRRIKKVGRAA
jgi:hypothetical protein